MISESHNASYPFTSRAASYVRDLGVTIPDLLSKRAYALARNRGRDRVIQAIDGRIELDTEISSELTRNIKRGD